jgi:predicted peptidase
MNQKILITVPVTSTTPNGRIPILRYDPQDESKPQALIIYLHGANCRSELQDLTTVGIIEDSSSGVPYYTNSAHPTTGGILPSYNAPDGEEFEFYVIAPQLWGRPNVTTAPGNTLWNNTYIDHVFDYAENPANGMNIDWGRVYLCGYSLGAGGTFTALTYINNSNRIAAAAGVSPGYFLGGNTGYEAIAKSGVPIYMAHSCGDTVTSGFSAVSDNLANGIRRYRPLFDPKYHRWYNNSHGVQHRLFAITSGASYSQANAAGNTANVQQLSENHIMKVTMYEWFLQTTKKDRIAPLYI